MTATNQQQLGNTLWKIADDLRGAMIADDFRDDMLSFLFLRYRSDNDETATKKEQGRDYPDVGGDARKTPEPTQRGANRKNHRHLPEPHRGTPLLPPGGHGRDREERLQPQPLSLEPVRGGGSL